MASTLERELTLAIELGCADRLSAETPATSGSAGGGDAREGCCCCCCCCCCVCGERSWPLRPLEQAEEAEDRFETPPSDPTLALVERRADVDGLCIRRGALTPSTPSEGALLALPGAGGGGAVPRLAPVGAMAPLTLRRPPPCILGGVAPRRAELRGDAVVASRTAGVRAAHLFLDKYFGVDALLFPHRVNERVVNVGSLTDAYKSVQPQKSWQRRRLRSRPARATHRA